VAVAEGRQFGQFAHLKRVPDRRRKVEHHEAEQLTTAKSPRTADRRRLVSILDWLVETRPRSGSHPERPFGAFKHS
jgi:hypothetical protein